MVVAVATTTVVATATAAATTVAGVFIVFFSSPRMLVRVNVLQVCDISVVSLAP
jgi:hypothetical protein